MSEINRTITFADQVCEIPCEEKNGILFPKLNSYGRANMSPLALKAMDMMMEMDSAALECVNMSGLYRTIWEQIAKAAEDSRMDKLNALKAATTLSEDYQTHESQLTMIYKQAQAAAWETIQTCVSWLIAKVRETATIAEMKNITLSMMTP